MVKKVSNESEVNYDVSLKHRLVGAAILILFAVIVLPWMLGSYSVDDNDEKVINPNEETLVLIENDISTDIEDKESTAVEIAQVEQEVKVFVSRVQEMEKGSVKDNSNLSLDEMIAKSDGADVKVPSIPVVAVEKKTQNKKITEKKAKPTIKVATKPVVKEKPQPVKPVIENGYIVSVGVFGNAANVEKLVKDLKSKKFSPSVRQEKFNKKTVSRIYMGPFSTRAKAGQIKLKLYEKENIPSLIKEFP